MVLLIVFFLVSILFSFLCSIWEAVLLSVTPSYTQRKIQEGGRTGQLLEEYKKDIDKPLSAILTLNTIAHTVGAIGVGAQASTLFESGEGVNLGFMNLSYESLIAAVMTIAILILSEIIPKTIGANMWRSLAPFTVRSLRVLMLILSPFVWISKQITGIMKKDKTGSVLNRADFTAMAQIGEQSGTLDKGESRIIRNLIALDSLKVRDIMTPRRVMFIADGAKPLMEFYRSHTKLPFSRIPIYKDKPDEVIGMVLKDELLAELVEDNDDVPLSSISRPIQAIRDDQPLQALFETLTEQRIHMAIVVDDFGSLVGLVTMEDLFETLLGFEIVDESDTNVNLQQLARQQWEARARKLGLIE
ncbi:MAG: CNNM domain-containing protein [Bacteroidota bacterium]